VPRVRRRAGGAARRARPRRLPGRGPSPSAPCWPASRRAAPPRSVPSPCSPRASTVRNCSSAAR
jgi:hypothetical protein